MSAVLDREREVENLGIAQFLINNRVGRIMQAIYAEEEKQHPDKTYLAALRVSHSAVWDDRRAMQGGKPDVVEVMIEKYDRLSNAEPTVHD